MKIIVTGAFGQLGYDLVEQLKSDGFETIGIGKAEADITVKEEIQSYIWKVQPVAVIHCAAYTNVDKAEDERLACYNINVNGTYHIAEICKSLNIKMMYISTDYIFDGTTKDEWESFDQPNPINYYGTTKLLGEKAILGLLRSFFIVRISWVFGSNGNNFVKTMLRLATEPDPLTKKIRTNIKVVNDQVGSPTYTKDLSKLLSIMIKTDKYGIYHATNEGSCSWAEFANEIMKLTRLNTEIIPILSEDYKTVASRPKNSKLSKKSLTDAGFPKLPDWHDSLKEYLYDLGYYNHLST